MFLFDALELGSVLLVWALKSHTWTWYFTPVISILIAFYLGYQCIGRLKKAVSELTDKTLSEEEQLKILKVMTRHYSEYSDFHYIKSHRLGNKAQIDIVLSFSSETTYREMIVLKNALQDEISELTSGSSVNIMIQ